MHITVDSILLEIYVEHEACLVGGFDIYMQEVA